MSYTVKKSKELFLPDLISFFVFQWNNRAIHIYTHTHIIFRLIQGYLIYNNNNYKHFQHWFVNTIFLKNNNNKTMYLLVFWFMKCTLSLKSTNKFNPIKLMFIWLERLHCSNNAKVKARRPFLNNLIGLFIWYLHHAVSIWDWTFQDICFRSVEMFLFFFFFFQFETALPQTCWWRIA